jgi:hypothetical protein
VKHILIFALGIGLQLYVIGQNINPGQDEIFKPDEVCKIELTMIDKDKDSLIYSEHPELRIYYPATIHFTNSLIDTIIDSVGVRNRGNTSIDNFKRPIKIDFREFGGAKFYDHKKFNLKTEPNDPSLLREYLGLYVMREAGVPAARASFATVYINGEYMGLYLNIEQIDDEFLDRRFDNDTGNLYKCLYHDVPADLRDESTASDNQRYVIKTNEEINDRSKLVDLINVLADSDNPDFKSELAGIFEIDMFLKYMAVESLLGHWDSPTMLANNYYLYENELSGKTVLIPYDLDNTLGIDWLGADWSEFSFSDWPGGLWQSNALSIAVGRVPEFVERYEQYIVTDIKYLFNEEILFPVLDEMKALISDYIPDDGYYPLDWGFTVDDFNDALTTARGNWIQYGIKPFISKRIEFAGNELGSTEAFESLLEVPPISFEDTPELSVTPQQKIGFTVFPNPVNGNTFHIRIEGGESIENISLFDVTGRAILLDYSRTGDKTMVIHAELTTGIFFLKLNNSTQIIIAE